MDKPVEVMYYMYENTVCAKISILTNGDVLCETYTSVFINKVFAKDGIHSIKELYKFFETRCFPKERANCKDLLKMLNLGYYNPYDIVHKTHGIMVHDRNWLKFEGEDLDYNKAKSLIHFARDLD